MSQAPLTRESPSRDSYIYHMHAMCLPHITAGRREKANVSRGRPAWGRRLHVTNSTHCVEFWGRLLIIHSKPTKNIKCRFMFSLNQQLLFNLANNKKYPQTDWYNTEAICQKGAQRKAASYKWLTWTSKTAHGEKSKEWVLKGENDLNNESQSLKDLNIWQLSQHKPRSSNTELCFLNVWL